MFSCPLVSPFETLWLTRAHEKYARRIAVGVVLSILLHVFIVTGVWFYHLQNPPALEMTINTGAPPLPLRVELVTQNSVPQEIKPPVPIKAEKTVQTRAESPVKQKVQAPPKKVESVVQPEQKKSVASSPVRSEVTGVNQQISLSNLRFRTSPLIPEYPALARRRGQQGTVVLLLAVEANGNISQASIARSSGFSTLDQSAKQAALKWELFPFKRDGVPVRREIRVPYEFSLT